MLLLLILSCLLPLTYLQMRPVVGRHRVAVPMPQEVFPADVLFQ